MTVENVLKNHDRMEEKNRMLTQKTKQKKKQRGARVQSYIACHYPDMFGKMVH